MSKEGDQDTTNQEISIICPAPRREGEQKQPQRQRQISMNQTDFEIDAKSMSALPLASLPTSDLTMMNTSAIQLCKQESIHININLENEVQDSPTLPKRGVIDFILKNAKKSERSAGTHTRVKLPKRQVVSVFVLLSIGLISLFVGVLTATLSHEAVNGAAYWSVAAICLLPGLFYARKLYQALYSRRNNDIKNQVMEEIPE